MRVLKFLLVSSLVLSIFVVIGALITREAILIWGVSTIRTSLGKMRSISRNYAPYAKQCRQKGSTLDTSLIESIQLRFTSETEYVVEVICSQFRLDPILVETGKLPPFVEKIPGNSGIVWGEVASGIGLEVFGRKRLIMVEQEEVLFDSVTDGVFFGIGPVSNCAGYGFACCETETTVGVGEQYTGVTDCPKSCFSACALRPVVLSFTSDPFMDPQTRTAQVTKGELVTFSYVINDQGTKNHAIVVDFGDGQKQSMQEITGSTTHTYQCAQQVCSYQAQIVVTDQEGIQAAETPLTKIKVEVR